MILPLSAFICITLLFMRTTVALGMDSSRSIGWKVVTFFRMVMVLKRMAVLGWVMPLFSISRHRSVSTSTRTPTDTGCPIKTSGWLLHGLVKTIGIIFGGGMKIQR